MHSYNEQIFEKVKDGWVPKTVFAKYDVEKFFNCVDHQLVFSCWNKLRDRWIEEKGLRKVFIAIPVKQAKDKLNTTAIFD